jgi:hypothetical protein
MDEYLVNTFWLERFIVSGGFWKALLLILILNITCFVVAMGLGWMFGLFRRLKTDYKFFTNVSITFMSTIGYCYIYILRGGVWWGIFAISGFYLFLFAIIKLIRRYTQLYNFMIAKQGKEWSI